MTFSSLIFLTLFLPLFLLSYFVIKNRKYRNFVILIFSLLFYAWGEPVYIFLILFSILVNYLLALLIDKKREKKYLILAVAFNLGLLIYYKYTNFIIDIFNINIKEFNVILPIGISFYTFQILTYVIDVYYKKVKVQKNIFYLGCYITFFPQLIAGPIVRYETIEDELSNRKETLENFQIGIRRFITGLGKKVLIADNVGYIATQVLQLEASSYGFIGVIFGMLAYSLQIYFDFSGYSDMAIGLGKMTGFNFLENFNYPYIAKSITDFWRRWHISL
jgi:alginate O-acetyltransferase complex protein AlgI